MGLNTVRIGDSLEKRVFDVLKSHLENEKLYIPGNRSKIFWKKAYYSAERGADIIFDIAIETYRPDAEQFALLTLIEVKNYTGSVPVGDIESFESRISQVGEHNTKGIFVSNSALQKSALEVARSKKIGIVKIDEDDSIEFLAERKDDVGWPKTFDFLTAQLTSIEAGHSFIATIEDTACYSLSMVLKSANIIDYLPRMEGAMELAYIEESEMERRLSQLGINDCYDRYMLNTQRLCEHISAVYDAAFEFDESLAIGGHLGILGKITHNPLKIFITSELKHDVNRWRFTYAHEISHLILHYHLFLEHYTSQEKNIDSLARPDWDFSSVVKKRMEHQANLMASHLLLPIHLLNDFIPKYFQVEGIHRGHIFVDKQPVNQIALMKLLDEMEKRFGVSKEVAKLRLLKLDLIKGQVQNESVHSLLRSMGYNTWNM